MAAPPSAVIESTGDARKAVSLAPVLEAEREEIEKVRTARDVPKGAFDRGRSRPKAPAGAPPLPGRDPTQADRPGWWEGADNQHWRDTIRSAHEANFVGLALSGGGIRSATFGLGVLQALAERGLLYRVDYLSTVSGGGYIGSWLAAWSRREKPKNAGGKPTPPGPTAFGSVQMQLATSRVNHEEDNEAPPIRYLRLFSNYLTPKLGFFSGDTWAVLATVVRNLILIQLIVVAALLTVLLLPYVLLHGVEFLRRALAGQDMLLAGVFAAALGLALAFIGVNMYDLESPSQPPRLLTDQRWILALVAAPIMVASFLGAVWLGYFHQLNSDLRLTPAGAAVIGAGAYASLWVAAYMLIGVLRAIAYVGGRALGKPKQLNLSLSNVLSAVAVVITSIPSGALAAVLYRELADYSQQWNLPVRLTLGVPAVLGTLLLTGTFQIGLLGRAFADAKREWWARLGGWLTLWGGGWLALFGIALCLPYLLEELNKLPPWVVQSLEMVVTPAWILSTLGGIFAAMSGRTSGKPGELSWRDWMAKAAPYLFMAAVISLLALAIDDGSVRAPADPVNPLHALRAYSLLAFASFALALIVSLRVDVNEFSLHALYRNRLVRGYLGASNENRSPNLFTGFDRGDDLPLTGLKAPEYSGPYPVLNAALNLVKGDDLAWQERKAASFVMTPLYCGFDVWLEEQDSPLLLRDPDRPRGRTAIEKWERAEKDGILSVSDPTAEKVLRRVRRKLRNLDRFGYRRTQDYASGLSLGAAMSISGAAANPNMGCYTSAPVAFLLTLFNVRLGQWLGNPRHRSTFKRAAPVLGLTYLLNELLAGTNDEARFVHVSDGGHFENMALYELVKRRCGLVILCDAEEDSKYGFAGLGNAIRKCRIDLGVDIDLDISSFPKPDQRIGTKHFAIGKIHYEMADLEAPTGTLIYLKASLTGEEPPDVQDYANSHPTFPHEKTANQWFTESQFESYRELGHHVASSSFVEFQKVGAAVLADFGLHAGGQSRLPGAAPGGQGTTTSGNGCPS